MTRPNSMTSCAPTGCRCDPVARVSDGPGHRPTASDRNAPDPADSTVPDQGSDAVPDGLLGLATALVGIPSVSHHEGAMADAVQAALGLCPWLTVDRVGDNVVARTDLGRSRRVLLAGHLDTVPSSGGNQEPRVEGSTLYGLGAADMKGGLAVFLHLAGSLSAPAVDVTWCFYAGEEVAREHNGLLQLWAERPGLLAADAAVLGEPTGGLVEAGCQGTLRLRVTLSGLRAHTARPHTGRNAIHRLAGLIGAVSDFEVRRPVIDGCEYAEQLQVVSVEGGVAGNVVPDRATVVVDHRFAPDRTIAQAESSVRELLAQYIEPGDFWELMEAAPGAPPSLDHPLLAALVAATGSPARAKVGWTDVAFFAERGVPAVNFGPGDPLLAHTPGECVSTAELGQVAEVLDALLRTGG
jgi:succinyl-diaminopimelate desuccinylase